MRPNSPNYVPPLPRPAKCRACQAELRFLVNLKTRKYVPVDLATTKPEDREYDPAKGHVSHFTTCTDPNRFSGSKPKAGT